MTTHTHAINAARSAGHPSMEVLTAAEADAIVGGGLIDMIVDAVGGVHKGFHFVHKVVRWPFEKVADAVGDAVRNLTSAPIGTRRRL